MLQSIIELGDYIAGFFNYELDLDREGAYNFHIKHFSNDKHFEISLEPQGNFNENETLVNEGGYWFNVVDFDEWRETEDGSIDTKYIVRELLNYLPSSELFFYKAIEESIKLLDIKEDIVILEFKRKDIANLFHKLAYTDQYTQSELISYFYVNKKIFNARIAREEELDLSNSNFPADNAILSSCNFLKKLSLANNNLEYLPFGIDLLKELQYLDISDNIFRGFPWEITNLSNLQVLIMQNALSLGSEIIIPEHISDLKSLQELVINQSFLDSLPESIGELKKLKKLTIEKTDISELPDSFFDLENLEELHLTNNRYLKVISNEVCRFKNLRYLYLYGNNLKLLPDSVGELVNLKTVNLGSNNIKILPNSFSMLENLEKLVLYNNTLSSFSKDIFKLPNLKSVDLRNNQGLDFEEIILDLVKLGKQDQIKLFF